MVLTYVQNEQDAEEIIQDVLIAGLEKLDSFRNESSLLTWIYSIGVNKCKDFLKAKYRTKRRGIQIELNSLDDDVTYFQHQDFKHPGILLEQKENYEILYNAINNLPLNQKTVLIMAKFDHKSYQEISEVMNMSVKAIDSLLYRAKDNLKKILKTQF
jgi:RNA polymerase sigma factor (sigma-70 family)